MNIYASRRRLLDVSLVRCIRIASARIGRRRGLSNKLRTDQRIQRYAARRSRSLTSVARGLFRLACLRIVRILVIVTPRVESNLPTTVRRETRACIGNTHVSMYRTENLLCSGTLEPSYRLTSL